MRQLPFDPEQLEVHVYNKIKLLDFAIERDQSFIGKLWNKFAGVETEVIDLDGIVIQQLFEIIGVEPPEPAEKSKSYGIHHQTVRLWYSRAFPDGVGAKGYKRF